MITHKEKDLKESIASLSEDDKKTIRLILRYINQMDRLYIITQKIDDIQTLYDKDEIFEYIKQCLIK